MKNAKKTLNVVLIAFIDEKGRVMLNKRSDANSEMWELIGGGIEKGESEVLAIRREVLEELGYTIESIDDELCFIDSFEYENEKMQSLVHVFTAKYPGIEKFNDSEEIFIKDLELFSKVEALQLVLLPMTRIILEKDLL